MKTRNAAGVARVGVHVFTLVVALCATGCGSEVISGGGDGGSASDTGTGGADVRGDASVSSDAWGGFCGPDGTGPAYCAYYTTSSGCQGAPAPCWLCGNELFSPCPFSVDGSSCDAGGSTCFACGANGEGQEYACSSSRMLWLAIGTPNTCAK